MRALGWRSRVWVRRQDESSAVGSQPTSLKARQCFLLSVYKKPLNPLLQTSILRGSNISDATPVVRIKGAIKKLADELHEMEVRIGVVSHTLLQLSLKSRRLMHAQAAIMSDEDDM